MTEGEFIALLEDFNDDGAALTWNVIYELSGSVAEDDVIRTDPPYTGDPIPYNSHILIYVSLGTVSSRWASVAHFQAAQRAIGVPVWYVFLDFEDDPVYLNHSNVTFPWDGKNWLGAGELGRIEFPDESPDMTAQSLKLVLAYDTSKVPAQNVLAIARESEYRGRDAVVYVAMHDPDTLALVDEPEEYWSGFMDVMTLEAGHGYGRIELTCEHWMRIAAAVSRYTDEHQKSLWSGDTFLSFLDSVREKGKWGGKDVIYGGGGNSPKGTGQRHHV